MSEEADASSSQDTRGIIPWFAKNSVASNILMFVLLVGGVLMLSQVKKEVFPEVSIDSILISVPYPGASPEEVEAGVVLAVEEAVRGIDGVKEVTATAAEGMAVVSVNLLIGADKERALNDVKAAVDRITSLPEEIERPIITIPTNRRQVVSLVLHGDVEEASLRELAESVRDDIVTEYEEVTYSDVTGTRPLEISVEASQEDLRAYGMTLGELSQAIRQASVEVPAGAVKMRSGEVLLRTAARRESGTEIANVVVRSRPDGSAVRIRDVARVDDGFREVDREASFGGERAAMVNLYRVGDQSPVDVAEAVKDWVAKTCGYAIDDDNRVVEDGQCDGLPPGVSVAVWNDASELYAQRVDLLLRNAFVGLILVLLVLGLFLEPRLAFWVTLGIPISFAGSLLFLPAADVSINMISLFAFIVTLGMVVDDAIVVGESIHQERSAGASRLKAAIRGAKSVSLPVCFSIITTCVFFAPLLFVPGVSGKFFRNIPVVVISVLLISLVESLFVLPAHLSHKEPLWLRGFLWVFLAPLRLLQKLNIEKGLLKFIDKVFDPVVRTAMAWRYVTLATSLAIFAVVVVGSFMGGQMKFTFMPKIEGDQVDAQLRMPVGTSIDDTREYEHEMVEAAQAVIDENGGEAILRGIFSQAGATSGRGGPRGGGGNEGSHLVGVRVLLVQSDQRNITTARFAEIWRERIGEIAGAENLTFSYSLGASAGQPIDVELTHPNPDVLEAAAERLAASLTAIPGLRDVDSGVSLGKEQLDLSLTDEGRARGLTEATLARQLRDSFFGSEASRQQRGRDELRVLVRRPADERVSMADIESLVVRTPEGGEMMLAQAANIQRGRAYTSIARVDGRRVISVTADVVAGVGNANAIIASLQRSELPQLLEDLPGLTYKLGGEQKAQAESMQALRDGFVFALLVVFGLLAIPFKSYSQPILVLSAIPFGFVGAFLGHLWMDFDLSIISMMGMVALSGVVVNDSLILIVAVNELRDEGYSVWDAVVNGAKRRFRPILLTSLTTFFGLVPMILEPSVQARFLVPMAVSLAFGVLFATLVLLLLVPALYVILEDVKGLFGALGDRIRHIEMDADALSDAE